MRSYVTAQYAFNLNYAKMQLNGVPEDQLCDLPQGLANHPTWIIGHLALVACVAANILEAADAPDPKLGELFGPGSEPSTDASQYPPISELMAILEKHHPIVADAYLAADDAVFGKENPIEGMREFFPTAGEIVTFMMTNHEAIHLGQLSTWRRAKGYKAMR